MVDVESGRIYEVLNPRDPPSWTAAKGVQRSKTIGAISSGHRAQNGFANYAVPRYSTYASCFVMLLIHVHVHVCTVLLFHCH